jgi:hypothetical protein
MLSLRAKIEIGAAALALVLCILGFGSWIEQHDARVKAEQLAKVQQTTIDGDAKQIVGIQDAEKQRDAETAAHLTSLETSVAKLKTPQQIAAWVPKQLPGLENVKITTPPATPQNPNPAAIATIPDTDLPKLRDTIEQCEECTIKLATAQADSTAKDSLLKLAGERLSAAEKQRDDYKQAMKGGTFLQRVKHNGKLLAIGAVIGAAAVCGSGHCK